MNGKFFKLRFSFVFLFILILALVNNVYAAEISASAMLSNVKSAIQSTSSTGFSEFKGAELGEYTVFYDLHGDKSAYVYKIVKDGAQVGYAVSTADSRFYPLFLISTGRAPQDFSGRVKTLAVSNTQENVIGQTLIYLGSLDFFVKYTYESGQVEYYNLQSGEKVAAQCIEAMDKAYQKKAKELDKFHPKAYLEDYNVSAVQDRFVDPNPGSDHTGSDSYAFSWYRGCSTTSLSMLLSWYGRSDNFYSNFGLDNYDVRHFRWDPDDDEGDPTYCTIPGYPQWYNNINWTPSSATAKDKEYLADQLADVMSIPRSGTGDYGATNSEMKDAIETVAKYNGYIFHANIENPASFDHIRTQIDNNRPMKLGFNSPQGSCPYSGHATFAFGYQTGSGSGNGVWLYDTNVDKLWSDPTNQPIEKQIVYENNCVAIWDAIFVDTGTKTYKDSTSLGIGDVYEVTDVQIGGRAIHYYEFTPSSQVEDITVTIDGSGGPWAFGYDPEYIVAKYNQNGGLILSFDHNGNFLEGPEKSNGNWLNHDWTCGPFTNNNLSKIVVGVASSNDGGKYTLKVEASKAYPNILTPTQSAPDFVGKPDDPSKTSIEVEVKTHSGTFITGLTKDNFEVKIGGQNAQIVSLVELADKYVLNVQPPNQAAEGLYDLVVTTFGESDTETEAIQYTNTIQSNVDVVQVIDRSGSMDNGFYAPGIYYLQDAKNAAKSFVDRLNTGDKSGLVSFSSSSRVDYPLTTITVPSQGNTVFSDNMESGTGNWSANSTWALVTSQAHSVTHSWTDSPGGNYNNNENTSLVMSTAVDLSLLNNPSLTFWTKYSIESGYDHGYVEISTDGGSSWTTLASYSGSADWTKKSIDLNNYADQQINIRFRLVTDSSVTYDGWYVDDVVIEESSTDVKQALKDAIDDLYANGGTSIGAGLQDAQDELTNKGEGTHPWAILLLSDGEENVSPYVSDVLPNIVLTKTKVFTIALGSYADEALLQDIASQTNGQYYLSPGANDLDGIYNSLSGQVAGQQSLFSKKGTVDQGQTDEKTATIDPSVKEAVFSISWSGASNDLDLTLEDPNGSVIDHNISDPNITYVAGNTSESYTVANPVPGDWIMRIYGGSIITTALNVPMTVLRDKQNWITKNGDSAPDWQLLSSMYAYTLDSGLEYTAQVSADTPLRMNIYLDKDSYETGNPILIRVIIADLQPITGATVKADVTTPSSTGSFSLYDDGLHGDAAANDGIYGNTFTETNEVGTYSFNVEASGTTTAGDSFTRAGYASTYVSDANDADGDGMPDNWESNVGLDPTINDSGNDPDADGLTNIQEYQYGTDPFSEDTDSDELTDGAEVNTYSTDPTKSDTDCGGESDGSEVANGRNPLDPSDDVVALQAEVQLDAGWNLISLSVQPENTSVDNVLSTISRKYTSVWTFQNNAWKVYDPAKPGFSDLATMEAGWGYWLNMREAANLTVSGTEAPKSVDLLGGWNLVGYNSTTSQPVANALASISGKVVSVWAYINGSWKVYNPASPGFSDLNTMEPGYGYWIKTTEACTWTLP